MCRPIEWTFDGIFGNDWSLLQPLKLRIVRLESWETLSGREAKSFPLWCNSFKEDKQSISLGIAEGLQSLRSNFLICIYGKLRNNTPTGSWLFGMESNEDDDNWLPSKSENYTREPFEVNDGRRQLFYSNTTQKKCIQAFHILQVLWQVDNFWVSSNIKILYHLQTTNCARKTNKIFAIP